MASDRVTYVGCVKFAEDYELDFRAYELRRGGRPLKLERIPMELLLLLVERQGELVTREEIAERIWGKDVFVDTDNSINAAIRKIRQVLKDDPEHPKFVQTITGRGYRFIAAIEGQLQPPALPAPEIPAPATDASLIAKKVSHYRVLKVVGGGGMGIVYQAEDLKLGRRVALKFLPNELATDPTAYHRLQSEARAASSLDHPNICSIYELGEHEGHPFIAMQYLEGQTLREWIEARTHNTGPLPMEEVLDLAIQIASGLEAAHQKGIVHRDIKPANIFITDAGQAKILDFGVAKFVTAVDHISELTNPAVPSTNPNLTRTGALMGTPSYISPEQIVGQKIDGRSDLFCLGMVLYEMATGRNPFAGETAEQIREAVLHQPATPIRQLNPTLCPQLEKIISRCLEKDRECRYQNATDIRVDAEKLKATLDRPVRSKMPAVRWIAVPVAALLITVPLFYLLIRPHVFRTPMAAATQVNAGRSSIAVLGFRNLSGSKDEAWLSTALTEMLATELAAGQKIRVIPDETVARMHSDLSLPAADSFSRETLSRIRTHLGADYVVLGSFFAQEDPSQGKLRLDLKLQDTRSGETVAVISREGAKTDIADLASRSGAGLRRKLGLDSISTDDAGAVRASNPSNSEAMRLYALGLDRLHSFDALGARDLLEKAVAADPSYALAHSALAKALTDLGYDARATVEAKTALDLSSGLARADRLLVEAQYRDLTHDLPAAVELYRTLHNFFPDDLQYALLLASAQTRSGRGKEALQTVAQMRSLPDPENRDAQIDLAEASAAQSLGDFKHSERAAGAGAARAEQQGSKMIMSRALTMQAWALDRMGFEDKAAEGNSKALEVALETGNRQLVASARSGIAIFQYNQGKFVEAQKSYLQALDEFRAIGDMWSVASCSHNLGTLLVDKGELSEAKKYLEDALRIQREINDDRGVAADLDDLGNVYESMGDLSSALRMKKEAVQLFHKTGDQKGEAITLGAIGGIQLKRGDLANSLHSYQESLRIKQANADARGQAYALLGIAYVQMAQDKLNDAHNSASRALAIRQQIQDLARSAEAQAQLAEIALEEGKPAEAESLARTAIPVLEQSKNPSSISYCYSVLTRALIAQNKMDEATAASKSATSFAQQAGDFDTTANAIIATASLNARRGQRPAATNALRNLEHEASKRGFIETTFEARLHLGELGLLSSENKPSASSDLKQLRGQAQQKGLLLISHRASLALNTVNLQTSEQARK